MRNKKREQRLIRIIFLLDGAELEGDRERIMDLLHSARRASREGDSAVAGEHSYNALRALNALSGRMQANGAAENTLAPLITAVDLLLPDFVAQEQSAYGGVMAMPPGWHLMALSIFLLSTCVIYGLWQLLNT